MSFASNPLSLCVPDDELHAWIYDAGPADEHDGHKRRRRRQQQQQHQPDVSTPEAQAAVQELLKPAAPWQEFFGGVRYSYCLPRSYMEAKLRLQFNSHLYIGNYIIIVLLIFIGVLIERPVALMGLACGALAWRLLASSPARRDGRMYRFQHTVVTLFSWVVAILANVSTALLLGLLICCLSKREHPPFRIWQLVLPFLLPCVMLFRSAEVSPSVLLYIPLCPHSVFMAQWCLDTPSSEN